MRYFNHRYFLLILLFSASCKKFLDTPANSSQNLINGLDECQALLNDPRVMNGFLNGGYPARIETSTDDLYVTTEQFNGLGTMDKKVYIWDPQLTTGSAFPDWDLPYRTVLTANTVLAKLTKLSSAGQQARWNGIKGSALFFRAFAFYQLAQTFSPPYDSSTAAHDLGIPLRLSDDINEKITRSTVQQTYDQILKDLRDAGSLLPRDSGWLPSRPSPAAVYALTSRVFLSARDYRSALAYADSSLHLNHMLMDYDTISRTMRFPFYKFNPEVIFSAAYYVMGPAAGGSRCHVDSNLFRSYTSNDLRKVLFFKDGDSFYGRYDENGAPFAGLTSSEMILTRSECYVRIHDTANAMADLNHLLKTRWAAGTFIPYTAANEDDALQKILLERRKELLFRGIRWSDLRRLNKDSATAHLLTRMVNGTLYTLYAKDARYTLPIPDDVLAANPGMQQNPR